MNEIELIIENTIVCGNPKIMVSSKQSTHAEVVDCVNGTQTIVARLPLGAYDTLEIKLIDRQHNNASNDQTTVEILDLYIDDINLQHIIFEGTQYPYYDCDFIEKFNPPRYYNPGTIFYNNGVFELDIQLPIHKFVVDSYEQKIS